MQFCQNPVECQPVLPHVQTSHGMLNIFVVQHAIQFSNMRVSTLKSQSGSTDKTLPVVCQKNIEIGAAAKAISQ